MKQSAKAARNDRQTRLMKESRSEHSDADRLRSGFDLDGWNAAVNLQVRIRDLISVPVSMIEAFEIAGDFSASASEERLAFWARTIVDRALARERARLADQERVSKEIGRNDRTTHRSQQ